MKHLLITLLSVFILSSCSSKSWRDASRESTGIAPKASELKEDIFLIYYARAFSWRGWFGVHPWVAWKLKDEKQYTVAQVTSWNIRRQGKAVRIDQDLPDRKWFDSPPTQLLEIRGDQVKIIVKKVKALIQDYPFNDKYRVWPGPNSNTFVAHLLREIDELTVELPANAIGKDYLGSTTFFSTTPSKTGMTFSILGGLGFTLGLKEGIEVNLLGLHLGIDLWYPALKLPILGRLGAPEGQ